MTRKAFWLQPCPELARLLPMRIRQKLALGTFGIVMGVSVSSVGLQIVNNCSLTDELSETCSRIPGYFWELIGGAVLAGGSAAIVAALVPLIGSFLKPKTGVPPIVRGEKATLPISGIEDGPRESLLKEYELAQDMHNYYGRITWEIASILLGGGVAALALAAPLPKVIFAFFALGVSSFISAFYLLIRRHSRVAELHLVRCREIEATLGLGQHLLISEGVHHIGGVKVPTDARPIRVPGPSGWRITQLLVSALVLTALGLAAYRLLIPGTP